MWTVIHFEIVEMAGRRYGCAAVVSWVVRSHTREVPEQRSPNLSDDPGIAMFENRQSMVDTKDGR